MLPRTDHAVPIALAALAMLFAMIAITAVTGVSQEAFEIVRAPDAYATALRAHPDALRAVFGVDSAFIVFYAAFFVVFARRIATSANRTILWLGVGFVLATAALDMIEDHSILSMLFGAELGEPPSAGQLAFQHVLSSTK